MSDPRTGSRGRSSLPRSARATLERERVVDRAVASADSARGEEEFAELAAEVDETALAHRPVSIRGHEFRR